MPKLNFSQLKHYWEKLKFEVKWRWEDIKHEHTYGMPDDPNEPPSPKVPIKVRIRFMYEAIIETFVELKNDTVAAMETVGLKSKKEPELPPNEESVQINEQTPNVNNNDKPSTSHMDDWQGFQAKFQHFVRTRFTLVQSSIRQFLIGYNEGMGRDLGTFKKKQDVSDLLGTSEMINKEDWMNKIRTMAGGLRKFREEMHGIAHIKEDDTLLKEDLEKAKEIQEKDSQLNLFKMNSETFSQHYSMFREEVKSKPTDLDTALPNTKTNEGTTSVNDNSSPKQNISS
ncbi:hypothetical protein FDP41_007748 [Naegleria fowleri]|uniref:Uncharacterized protein n=1 Tax=Naegleria fowleri TaxID=5763 RepID=A0A6A5C083_NAEFO|nr:uncharacterized protein FDP41_007748 [Naegleria fowleri]KAF0983833.1 hypothetical protein FDP41_007748 [Naegleria fowleri]CAG4714662.1 unnamed protein product [Naegleria fowleri]